MNEQLDYTIYSKATNEILRVGKVPDEEHALLQVQLGEGLILKALDFDTQYVRNGRIRHYSESEKKRRADRPHDFATWDVGHMAWVDVRSVSEINAWKRGQIVQQIVALEDKQPRAMRDALLNQDTTGLQKIEDQISILREELNRYKD